MEPTLIKQKRKDVYRFIFQSALIRFRFIVIVHRSRQIDEM